MEVMDKLPHPHPPTLSGRVLLPVKLQISSWAASLASVKMRS